MHLNSSQALWTPRPENIKKTQMYQFAQMFADALGVESFKDYRSLHESSVNEFPLFWKCFAEYTQLIWQIEPTEVVYKPGQESMLGASWFVGSKLNYAENLLETCIEDNKAIIEVCENNPAITLSFKELKLRVAVLARYFKNNGVKKGDRIAAVLSNQGFAVIGALASASIGAIWTSASPDFGAQALLDRFSQVEPKLLLTQHSYTYAGKSFQMNIQTQSLVEGLNSLEGVIFADSQADSLHLGMRTAHWQDIWEVESNHTEAEILSGFNYEPCEFDDPLFILYSSGTTGEPKCIVHGIGGTLLQHKKELQLHCDINSGDKLMYFTTCGWMMWNWQLSVLSCGATLVLYDGSPAFPEMGNFWKIATRERIDVIGTSPKYISSSAKNEVSLEKVFDEFKPRAILSTGAPLLEEHFEWIYTSLRDVQLASISGGTDIVSCFMLGNPLSPVYSGYIQGAGLGMAVEAWEADGKTVLDKQAELVCTKPFVSMPIGFWKDEQQKKYRKAYFENYDRQVWHHGDYIEIDSLHGGVKVYGRSDTTLNPAGVRIGTAELYRVTEKVPEIKDSIAGSFRKSDGDVEIVLAVVLAVNFNLEQDFITRIKKMIRSELTPRHVPKHIFSIAEVPYTRSGKKLEKLFTAILNGEKPHRSGVFASFAAVETTVESWQAYLANEPLS